MSLEDVERRLRLIEERNARVEADKAWEVSPVRRAAIATLTYLVAVGYLTLLGGVNPWLGAAVPAGGYLLSTLALGGIRRWWLRRREPRNEPQPPD